MPSNTGVGIPYVCEGNRDISTKMGNAQWEAKVTTPVLEFRT